MGKNLFYNASPSSSANSSNSSNSPTSSGLACLFINIIKMNIIIAFSLSLSLLLLSCSAVGNDIMTGKIDEIKAVAAASEINYIVASEKYLSEIDAKAKALKDKILNSNVEIAVKGSIYYVSNKGDDLSDGKSPETAWATLKKVSGANLKSGDAVLFERGGTFRGNINAKEGVTYSAYGKGDKPEILGSPQNYSVKGNWKETETANIYVYDEEFSIDAGLIVFNNGEAWSYKQVIDINGFTGNIDEMKNDLEMYHDPDDKKIYLYSDKGNPADRYSSIEFCLRENIIDIAGNDITIDNLCIKFSGRHGILYFKPGIVCRNLTVTNCEIGWIGGSFSLISRESKTTRYGNAVTIVGNCENYTIDSCYVYQVYDAGISHQIPSGSQREFNYMDNVRYTNNLIEYTTYPVEYFLGTPAEGTTTTKQIMSDILIKDNILRFTGYGWGDQRPNKVHAAHIKGWDHINPAENFVIEDNILDRSKYMMIHMGAANESSLPVMKNNIYLQYADSEFGKFGVNPTKLAMYGKDVERFIKSVLKEQGAEIRYILPEGRTRLPFSFVKNMQSGNEEVPSFLYTANDGTVLPFRLILPEKYDKNKKYPLVLYLHSQNQRGNDNTSQITNGSYLIERLYDESNPDYSCIILAPQCPKDAMWVNTQLKSGNYSIDKIAESKYISAVISLVNDIKVKYNADENRLYAAGYSMGGYGVWDIAARYPDMFAAIIPVGGAGDESKAGSFKGTAVWAFHGLNDYNVPDENTKNMVSALEAAGVDLRYTGYENEMMECWGREDLLSWLFGIFR